MKALFCLMWSWIASCARQVASVLIWQVASVRGGAGASDGEGSDEADLPPLHFEVCTYCGYVCVCNIPPLNFEEPYWGIDDYAYEMEAMARGRFGRNMRHEASKQVMKSDEV